MSVRIIQSNAGKPCPGIGTTPMSAALALLAAWLSASAFEKTLSAFACIALGAVVAFLMYVATRWARLNGQNSRQAMLGPGLSLALIISVGIFNWPLRISYAFSKDSLDLRARQLRAGKLLAMPQRVGLFTIRKAEIN